MHWRQPKRVNSCIVVVGGGQVGAQAIDTLRREGFKWRLVLVSDEPHLPYQRPPLSKKFLSGELKSDRLLYRQQAFYEKHRVGPKLGASATSLDPGTHRLGLSDGEHITYHRLLLCTGAVPRRLSCPGADLGGVHYLRGISDVEGSRGGLEGGAA